MLEIQNFCSHDHIYNIFELPAKTLLVTSWTEIVVSYPLFQNTFTLRRPGVTSFADIIKISTMFVKTTFKDSKKVRRIRLCKRIRIMY